MYPSPVATGRLPAFSDSASGKCPNFLSFWFRCLMRDWDIVKTWRYPPTPRLPVIPLPGQAIYSAREDPLFPINLRSTQLSSHQKNLLSDPIPALTTISVQDMDRRVLCNVNTGSYAMTSADFAQFLQFLVLSPLPSYSGLSSVVQHSVEEHFHSTWGPQAFDRWQRFVAGTPRFGSPTGLDLLLGRSALSMLDTDFFGSRMALVDYPSFQ
ncbi:hypothetical protein C8R43DRAFT_4779 [Mycena crocata]|nr:hypothetical protein C8R43DRAFT_4779 [Mycena crocata]